MVRHQRQWMESPELKSTKFALGMARLSSRVPLSSGLTSQCPDTGRTTMDMVLNDNKTLSNHSTDISTSDSFKSDSSSGNGSAGMFKDSSSLQSAGCDEDAMSTSSLLEDV